MWPNPFLRIWSHFLKKSLIENFIFCAVLEVGTLHIFSLLKLKIKTVNDAINEVRLSGVFIVKFEHCKLWPCEKRLVLVLLRILYYHELLHFKHISFNTSLNFM